MTLKLFVLGSNRMGTTSFRIEDHRDSVENKKKPSKNTIGNFTVANVASVNNVSECASVWYELRYICRSCKSLHEEYENNKEIKEKALFYGKYN